VERVGSDKEGLIQIPPALICRSEQCGIKNAA
jgi:hypothetical protein